MQRRTFIRIVGGVGLASPVPLPYVFASKRQALSASGVLIEAASFAKPGGWKLDTQHYQQMDGCYSKSTSNLMMAGRCFSCSHIGLCGPRVMKTCGQMGIATGYAAALCRKHDVTPREVGQQHLRELRQLIGYEVSPKNS